MIKLLGGLPFALILIGATLLFVIAGTFLESWTESHLFAAHLTYQNPLFQVLLWLYFINILFAALSRYPFQKKHIPFLLTHLGLLMLLAGVFVKNHFGVQGACALAEGSGCHDILLPNTYALQIENPSKRFFVPLKKGKVGPIESGHAIEITLLEWTPHTKERLEGFIKGNWGHLIGFPPFEIGASPLATEHYLIYSRQTDHPHEIPFPGKASLFFLQDQEKRESLLAFNAKGERFFQPISQESYLIYNKGYGGYALFAELPSPFPPIELIAPLTRTWSQAPLPQKREEATPRIRLLATSGEHSEIVTLCYDRFGQTLKWPILGGKYLIRFQSNRRSLPSQLRLHAARQINYMATEKPYSYEADVTIDGKEITLSMNHVFEKKGYRYYLANLLTSPTGAHRVQIVVNYDPAKYWLTYPGAILLALGIVLLYLRRRYA